jgi:hypothetical protein
MGIAADEERPDAEVSLDNGILALVRPISPTDAPTLLRLHSRLSGQSIPLRCFYPQRDLSPDVVAHLTQVDDVGRVALVVDRPTELIAIATTDSTIVGWPESPFS